MPNNSALNSAATGLGHAAQRRQLPRHRRHAILPGGHRAVARRRQLGRARLEGRQRRPLAVEPHAQRRRETAARRPSAAVARRRSKRRGPTPAARLASPASPGCDCARGPIRPHRRRSPASTAGRPRPPATGTCTTLQTLRSPPAQRSNRCSSLRTSSRSVFARRALRFTSMLDESTTTFIDPVRHQPAMQPEAIPARFVTTPDRRRPPPGQSGPWRRSPRARARPGRPAAIARMRGRCAGAVVNPSVHFVLPNSKAIYNVAALRYTQSYGSSRS